MKTAMSRVMISMLVVFMMVAVVAQPILSMENNPIDVLNNSVDTPSTNEVGGIENEPITNGEAFPKRLLYKEVVVATDNVAELAAYLSAYDYDGIIGTAPSNRQGIAFPVLGVPPEAIEGIAGLSSVMGVYDYVEPVSYSDIDGTSFSRSLLGLGPNSPILESPFAGTNAQTLYHGAEDAWANGFTGDGVQIATVTSGTDFGNMELRGSQAIVDNDIAIANEVVVESTSSNTTNATLDMSKYYKVIDIDIYVNDVLRTSGYTVTNHTIDFDPLVGPDSWINATYTYRSPYFGYPIVFDPTSMSAYIADGELQPSTINPGESWYVNTSSTDLHIYHTVVVDGANDFWAEENTHGSSEAVYPLSLTSELRAEDPAKDISDLELDLKDLYSASDSENWYFGFSVTPYIDTWSRSYDVNYGIYIDSNAGGATTDPEGNYITATGNEPEYAIYFHHTGSDWGVTGFVTKYTNIDQQGAWSGGTKTIVNWGVDTNGKWSNNKTMSTSSIGDAQVVSDLKVWSNNNTVQNATLYIWNEAGSAWSAPYTIIEEQAYNVANGIGPMAGSRILENITGKYLIHQGNAYKINPNGTVNFTLTADHWVGMNLTFDMGEQEYTGDFIEFSVPKKMMASNSFSIMMFSVGNNASHAQDSVPSDANVTFEYPEWNTNITNLVDFFNVGAVPEYVVTGIPSVSGEYRIGLHPDKNLMIHHYGRPVAVLVTDMYVSGEYNAVYVDLDNDKDFTDEIPAMNYGVYNDTENIGPRYDFIRQANNTVLKDGVYYPIRDETIDIQSFPVTNEVLVLGSAGNEWNFTLANQNITVPPTIQRNYTVIHEIENETVEGPTFDGQTGPINLVNGDVINCTLFVDIAGEWIPLAEGSDYTINYITGEMDTSPIEPYEAGWIFYAYYNYSEETTTIVTYTIDTVSGELMLDAPLEAGDDLITLSYSYEVTTITHVNPFIDYMGTIYNIELRDWVSNKDIDADIVWNHNGTGDEMPYPDLSGGMVYFIADGDAPVPYSDIYWEWNSVEEEDRILPENGDLVAFFGEFDESSAQGTEIGSAICAKGNTVDGNDNALVKGMAPDAKLISIRGGAFGSWYFAVEGYDGVVGTEDDAQIVAVTTNFPVANTGWDVYTKGAEYIGSYYAEGRTVFIAGTGDSGFGYGTTASPGSSDATITAGQGTQFDYRCYKAEAPDELARVYADQGVNPHHGDVLPSSGRGPNMLGNPEPDVITAGAFNFGATPLNIDQDLFTPSVFDWYGGQWAWDLWSGSALSASTTAGIMALIYDAYYQTNGEYPNVQEARSLLRSGADNLNYDALTQGAGWSNADRSTKLAAEMDGLYLDNTYWVPGDYRGVRYEGFVKLMEPGESATETITVENMNPSDDAEVMIYDSIFHKFDEYSMDINITKTYDDANIPAVINIEPYIAVGTELLKVTATSARKGTMQTYMAELFDWTDVNENGELNFPGEQNRMTYVIGSNSLELRYRDPLGRVHDGLAVQIKGFGGAGEPLDEWTIHLDFYEKVDWNWLSISGAPDTVANGTNGTTESFDIDLDIPNDADVGSYEGSVYINKKVPEEQIATGVGEMMHNISFKLWFNNPLGSEGIINDNETKAGNRSVIPKSSIISWNGTTLYEGIDYILSGTGGDVKFSEKYPNMKDIIPEYVPWFNMTYLTVEAQDGTPTENAAWTGKMSVPNTVKDEYTLWKDGDIWDEEGTETDESVLVASGGELIAGLANRNIIRETYNLTKNGSYWPQDGGDVTEQPIADAIGGEDYAQLSHGNIVPGSTEVYINTELLPQTGEITLLKKEEVTGLNSTSTDVTAFELEELGMDVAGSIWNDTGTWYGKMPVNKDDTPDFTLLSYVIYEDGVAMTDGLDFQMHVDTTHGKIKFSNFLDPTGNTYTVNYTYYNHTISVGQLSHRQVISESYKLYRNGAIMKSTEYELDLETGVVTMAKPLGADEIVDAAYKFNLYMVDLREGNITITDALSTGDDVDVTYSYYNYTLDMATGALAFADPLEAGDVINANYTYANYTLNMMKGIVKFSNALMPGEVVTCEYFFYSNVIPVFFNIGADKPDFEFGGPDSNTTVVGDYDELYKYNEIRGGYGGGGDWMYIYLDIKEEGKYAHPVDNERLFIDIEWEYDQTDVNVQVYGGRQPLPGVYTGWPYDPLPADEFGPHTIGHVGGSDVTSGFFTTTGGPEEIVSPPISAGLNVIGVNTVGMNGSVSPTEQFSGSVGTMYLDPTEIKIVTNQYVGETQIGMISNKEWEGVGGIAAGPSAPESLKNQTVHQDDADWSNYDTFEEQLASGSTVYSRTIKDCLIFHVHIWGHDNAPDLDLGVFLDGSGEEVEEPDGIVQADEFVAYGADFDADEEVKLIAPKDGTYLIVPFGFTLTMDPAMFDMDITIVQGTGFDLQGKGDNSLPADQKGYFSSNQTEDAFNQTYLNMAWDLPGSATGTLQGALYIGPGNGPMCMLVPIELTIDTDAPLIANPTPSEGAYTNNQKPEIVVSVSDFDRAELMPDSMKLYVDGVDVSVQASVSIPYNDDAEKGLIGYGGGTVAYKPYIPLIDGAHVVKASIMDKAGNIAIKEWAFTVDSSMPSVEISYPAESVSYVNTDSITVTGIAEAGVELEIVGTANAELMFGNYGAFSVNIGLAEGENSFIIRATDLAGNTIDITRTVHMDDEMPEIDSVRFSTGYITNEPLTTMYGSLSEMGTLIVDGVAVTVNSDGSFSHVISLIEGVNTIHLEFADMAGNVQHDWYNITLDTIAPVISLSTNDATVYNNSFELIGTVEAGAEVFVNGKRTTVGTRQSGEFSTILTLSPGINNIVIEAEDSAGNIAQYTHTVEYDPDYDAAGVNWPAIGVMITLLVVGLLLGLLFGGMLLGGREPLDEPPMDEIVEDEGKEVPEDMPMDQEIPEDDESLEAGESALEDIPEEDIPEDEYSDDSALEEQPDEIPEEVPDEADTEPIPEEDEIPEEVPDEVDAEPIPEEEGMPEEINEEADAEEPSEAELPMDEGPEAELPMDERPEADAPSEDEDPRIAKLRDAFESGKISEELYEKNLARFKEQ